jgi:2-polyprenyl-6-methoxyphenol hydroxylase-like FAD-dependent oxidoreductase
MHALIIGGGIGGATAAIALRHAGLDVTVCERAPMAREVGAGVALGANAMNCLRQLRADEAVLSRADRITTTDLLNARGRVLIHTPVAELERDLPAHSVLIHRADLLDALLSRLPHGLVRFDRACTGVEQDPAGVVARFADGSEERADLLIGADGIRSVVRAALLGDAPTRYSGYTCWRGVVAASSGAPTPAGLTCEYWGRGARFGFGRCGRERVYWYATANAAPNGADAPDPRPDLLRIFGAWAAPVPALIGATPPAAIIRSDIVDRPPSRRWGEGRMTLLGDAAHPTTPNLGQGACMAIEDAVALARHLRGVGPSDGIEAALRAYERSRMPRTAMITNASWRLGKVGQWESRAACAARDTLLGVAPSRAARRGHRRIAGHIESL